MIHDDPIAAMHEGDRRLLSAALRWARDNSYERLPVSRTATGLHRTWISDDLRTCVLTLGNTLAVTRPDKPVSLISADTVTELLSMLACLKVLPARFSNLGREALDAHADECETYSRHLLLQHREQIREPVLAGWATAWRSAADAARRFDAREPA